MYPLNQAEVTQFMQKSLFEFDGLYYVGVVLTVPLTLNYKSKTCQNKWRIHKLERDEVVKHSTKYVKIQLPHVHFL